MPAILERMPSGILGDISRRSNAVTEAIFIGSNDISYGAAVQLDANGKLTLATDDEKAIYGFLVRPYPTESKDNKAPAGSIGDVLRSGYMSVKILPKDASAAIKGAAVKIVFTAEAGFLVGDISATKGTDIANCTFMGGADASGNAEIAFNI